MRDGEHRTRRRRTRRASSGWSSDRPARLLVSLSYDRTMRLWDDRGATGSAAATAAALPGDVWPRSCAFAGGTRAGVRDLRQRPIATYDYQRPHLGPDARSSRRSGVNAVLQLRATGRRCSVGDAGHRLARRRPSATRLGSLCNFLRRRPAVRCFTGGQLGKLFDARTGRASPPAPLAAQLRRRLHARRLPARRDRARTPARGWCSATDPDAEPSSHVVTRAAPRQRRSRASPCSGDVHLLRLRRPQRRPGSSTDDARDGRALRRDAHDRIANGCAGAGRRLVRQREPRPAPAPVDPGFEAPSRRHAAHALDQVRRGLRRRPC